MNHRYVPTANTLGKKETRSPAALALVVGLVLTLSGAVAWAETGAGTGTRFTTPNGMQVEVTTVNGRPIIAKILVPVINPATGLTQFIQVDTFNGAGIALTSVGTSGQIGLAITPAGSTTPLTPEQAQQALQTGTTQSLTASIASGQLPPNTPLPSLMMHWKQTKNAPGYVIKFTDVIITSGTAPRPDGGPIKHQDQTKPRPDGIPLKPPVTLPSDGAAPGIVSRIREVAVASEQSRGRTVDVDAEESRGRTLFQSETLGHLAPPSPEGDGKLTANPKPKTDLNSFSFGTAAPSPEGDGKPPGRSLSADFVRLSSGMRITKAADDAAGLGVAALEPKGEVGKLPGKIGEPISISGTSVGLEGEPGGSKFFAKTDANGAFQFAKVPAGNYKLIIDRLPARSVTVGTDGEFGGTLRLGSDGSKRIFDRWGNLFTDTPENSVVKNVDTSDKGSGKDAAPDSSITSTISLPLPSISDDKKIGTPAQAAGKPVAKTPDTGFGRGNTMGGGFSSGSGPGAMAPPGGPGTGAMGSSPMRPGGPGGYRP